MSRGYPRSSTLSKVKAGCLQGVCIPCGSSTGGTSRNCRFLSAHGDAEDAAKSAGGARRTEGRPGSNPPESQPAARDVDRDGNLRVVANVADWWTTDQPGCADIEGLAYLQIDRVRLILRQSVAEHSEGAEEDHHDAGRKPSCPHMPPHGRV